jgi:hypothetical protein
MTTIAPIDVDNLYIVNITDQSVVNKITRTSFDSQDSFEQRAEDVCEQYCNTYTHAWFEIYTPEDLYNDAIPPVIQSIHQSKRVDD